MNDRHSISIAVLSQNQDDVALINGTLRDGGHAAHCHWIDRPGKLDDTLAADQVELIIVNCDRYPEGIRRIIKQKDRFNPEVPVIALRQEADENTIQEAMRDGACDLVSIGLKNRLQSVVTRELRALRAERALNSTIASASEYKRQIRDYMQSSTAAIALAHEGIVLEANDAWLKLFKYASVDEVKGLPLMDSFDSQSHAALKGALNAAIKGKWAKDEKLRVKPHLDIGHRSELELEFQRMDFDSVPCVHVRIAPPDPSKQEPTALVHDALKRDPTTLFYHRAQFIERLGKRLKRKPKSGLHVLAYVKIDKFAEVQKKIGIIESEEVLAQFAEEMRKRMHPRDVAGRFEGTSLMVLLERGNARDGQGWGRQLAKHISNTTFDVGEKSAQITCTVGVCAVSDVFSNLEELVTATVDAYELGKAAGGNTCFLNESAHEDTKQKEFDAIWVKRLKAALMDDRFMLAQLPIAGLRRDSIEMYDLLVRMVDEQGSPVLPSEFIPAAERSNMMKNIDRWMIKAAIDFCEHSNVDRVFVETVAAVHRRQEHDRLDATRVRRAQIRLLAARHPAAGARRGTPHQADARHGSEAQEARRRVRARALRHRPGALPDPRYPQAGLHQDRRRTDAYVDDRHRYAERRTAHRGCRRRARYQIDRGTRRERQRHGRAVPARPGLHAGTLCARARGRAAGQDRQRQKEDARGTGCRQCGLKGRRGV